VTKVGIIFLNFAIISGENMFDGYFCKSKNGYCPNRELGEIVVSVKVPILIEFAWPHPAKDAVRHRASDVCDLLFTCRATGYFQGLSADKSLIHISDLSSF
jgi:hypothetical protein